MTVVKCDRCDVEIKNTKVASVEVKTFGFNLYKDLCEGCRSRLKDFFAPLPPVKPPKSSYPNEYNVN